MKILVTGGAGYIGSHTVKELIREGFDVLILDNFSSGRRELIKDGELIEGDLLDKETVSQIFKTHPIQAVLHFASLIQVGESYAHPRKYYEHNIVSSLNLLNSMQDFGVKSIIFSSSAAVYGVPQEIPIPESHPLEPINPYGWTKLIVEKILEDYERAYGLKFISLRYFNASGADPDSQLGEMHEPETHLIPNILLFLLKKKKHFYLFGNDFPTPDGTAVRDYIHVTDLAKAHVLALKKILDVPQSHIINLGTNQGYSILEVLEHIKKCTGLPVQFVQKNQREGDVPILQASKERAEKVLGWKPEFSDIDTIIRTAWSWHQKQR